MEIKFSISFFNSFSRLRLSGGSFGKGWERGTTFRSFLYVFFFIPLNSIFANHEKTVLTVSRFVKPG